MQFTATLRWFGFTRIESWKGAKAVQPHWRLYWNPTPGAIVSHSGSSFALDEEFALLIPPHCPVEQRLAAPCETLYVHFSLGRMFDIYRGRPKAIRLSESEKRQMLELSEAFENAEPHWLAVKLCAWACSCVAALEPSEWEKISDVDPRMQRVAERIEKNLRSACGNTSLAKEAGLSVNSLIRLFKKSFGESPKAYSQRRRLAEAATLLVSGDASIDEIAFSLGFYDRNHFTRRFSKHFGSPPAKYRERREV